jgi:hypothetical protein
MYITLLLLVHTCQKKASNILQYSTDSLQSLQSYLSTEKAVKMTNRYCKNTFHSKSDADRNEIGQGFESLVHIVKDTTKSATISRIKEYDI